MASPALLPRPIPGRAAHGAAAGHGPAPQHPPLIAPAGLPFPRGRISEISGGPSSGRTSLLFNALAQATAREGDLCAIVDAGDAFDPNSAAAAGVVLRRVLWVRSGGVEKAFRATDLLLRANGFGVVVMDLGDIDPLAANRIPLSYWYRFRRAVEQTRTAFIVVSGRPNARQCASFAVDAERRAVEWSGAAGCSRLLEGVDLHYQPRKPPNAVPARIAARAAAGD